MQRQERATTAPNQHPAAIADPLLIEILNGLVALQMLRLSHSDQQLRTQLEASDLAYVIAEHGDRLTNSGSFQDEGNREERGRVLNAMATCLAVGALHDGGVTWAGHHWCTAPHPACPNGRV